MITIKSPSKKVWVGQLLSGSCVLFLLADAILKIVKAAPAIQKTVQLGWPEQWVPTLGIVLLTCTFLYGIPRTALFGAILLTGYLGGAIAIMVRAHESFFFPAILCVLLWVGLFLRFEQLRQILLIKNT